MEGKTEQARADLARLAIIKKEIEKAARKKAEKVLVSIVVFCFSLEVGGRYGAGTAIAFSPANSQCYIV